MKINKKILISTLLIALISLKFNSFLSNSTNQINLSPQSEESFKKLSSRHAISISSLSSEKKSPLTKAVLKASVTDHINNDNLGIIFSIGSEDNLFLMNPSEETDELELEIIAREFKNQIPEINDIEVDQNIELSNLLLKTEQKPQTEVSTDLKDQEEELNQTSGIINEIQPIRVAVLDSGIDETHPIFQNTKFEEGWNLVDDNTDTYDDINHGTHVSGIIAANSLETTIIPYKIINKKSGRLSDVIKATQKAIEADVDVVNLSFGFKKTSPILHDLIKEGNKKGIIFVTAAGNENSQNGFYPAKYPETISVAALDNKDHKLSVSNYGSWVDVAANGYMIRSSIPHDLYDYMSGTSQSTAYVSAEVVKAIRALNIEKEKLSAPVIIEAMSKNSQKAEDPEIFGLPIIK